MFIVQKRESLETLLVGKDESLNTQICVCKILESMGLPTEQRYIKVRFNSIEDRQAFGRMQAGSDLESQGKFIPKKFS